MSPRAHRRRSRLAEARAELDAASARLSELLAEVGKNLDAQVQQRRSEEEDADYARSVHDYITRLQQAAIDLGLEVLARNPVKAIQVTQ